MKLFATLGLLAGIAGAGLYFFRAKGGGHVPPPPPSLSQADPPTAVKSDAREIFQRAFWRHPSELDKILHAERREWSDADGLRKWQWFLVVEPSPELVKHLREDNAFNLSPTSDKRETTRTPPWFTPPSDSEVLQAPHGGMRLAFARTGNLLYSTDSGGGFQTGAPEPARESPAPAVPNGRLPSTPPPDPGKR